MMRQWIAAPDPIFSPDARDEEIYVRHVVPGKLGETGEPITHGHILNADCDCKPRIEETLDTIIVIHRWDC